MPRTAILSETEQAQAAASYQAGSTLAQLADAHGVSPSTVRNALAKQGVQTRPRGGDRRSAAARGEV